MKLPQQKITEWFLRIALSAGFLSASADRFGFWDKAHSAWGNWENFLAYTKTLNFWLPASVIPFVGALATFLEIALALGLLTNYKTPLFAKASGFLLLLFAISMTMADSIKGPLDYSVFTAAAAAFALSVLTSKKG